MESRKIVFLGSILLGCLSGVILYLCMTRTENDPAKEQPIAAREVSEPQSVSSPVSQSVGTEVSPAEMPSLPQTLPSTAPSEEKNEKENEELDWGDLPGLDSVGQMELPAENVVEETPEVEFSVEEPTFVLDTETEVPGVLPDADKERAIHVLPQEEIRQVSYEEPVLTVSPVKESKAIRLGPPPRTEKKKSVPVK